MEYINQIYNLKEELLNMKNNNQSQVTANLIDQLTRTAKQVKDTVIKQVTPQMIQRLTS